MTVVTEAVTDPDFAALPSPNITPVYVALYFDCTDNTLEGMGTIVAEADLQAFVSMAPSQVGPKS